MQPGDRAPDGCQGPGRVVGAQAHSPQGAIRVEAAAGVVLAAGGFPHDVQRRRALFPGVRTGEEHWTLAPTSADGAGVSPGETVGGLLRTDLAAPAAWCPVSLVPYRSGKVGTFPHIMDRAKPGSIGVLSNGRRFVNEANGYHDPSLAPVDRPPFYAVKVLPGSFGTFAGLASDERARVLDRSGTPIPGLYAVGADQANVMGGHYPAGGINIGPAMVFGYIAGRDLAGPPAEPAAAVTPELVHPAQEPPRLADEPKETR